MLRRAVGRSPRSTRCGAFLRLRPNELLGLLGPNGAGKTTAMKLVVGDERASAGQVEEFIQYFCSVFGKYNIYAQYKIDSLQSVSYEIQECIRIVQVLRM